MIVIDKSSHLPLYAQLYESVRSQIVDGSMPSGSKLPAIRQLASDLGVARNTVELAYQQLAAEGYVTSRSGSGYRVEDIDFSLLVPLAHEPGLVEGAPTGAPAPIAMTAPTAREAAPRGGVADVPVEFDFSYGDRGAGSFPSKLWVSLTAEALRSNEGDPARYSDPLGVYELREIIARNLLVTRGVRCDPEQVVIQPGTQESIDRLTGLFDPARDVVAMEDPGYDGVRCVFENRGFKVVGTDAHSTPDRFRASLYDSGATLAFVTPSNQFPTGRIMSLESRIDAMRWALTEGAYLIEDDYCREYRYTGMPVPSLQSLDGYGRVVYLGTLSKMLSPALRVSYAVLPQELLGRWKERYHNRYCSVPWLTQKTLALFGTQGHWDRYVRKAFSAYRASRDELLACIDAEMGGRVEVVGGDAGLHVLVSTLDGRTQGELIAAAAEQGVAVYPTAQYWMAPYERRPANLRECVLVGFSAIARDRIAPGVRRLRHAWFG